jgi:hypothetical protein
MPITKADRIARKFNHTKQERLQISNGVPSLTDLRVGVPVLRSTNEGMVEYVRYNNTLYKKVLDRDVIEPRSVTTTKNLGTKAIFEAHVGSIQSNLALSTEVVLQMNTADIDTMSSYDTSNYLYTVSVSGIYFLYYNVTFNQFDSGMTYAQSFIKDNSGSIFGVCRIDDKEFTADTAYVNKAAHVVKHLTAGTTLGVYYYQAGGTAQVDVRSSVSSGSLGAESIFGGFLLTEPKAVRKVEQQAGEETVAPDSPL